MSPAKTPNETRARILNAAFEEFYCNGFQAGSLNKIIKAADTTKGGLFHHFSSKFELGYAVVDELLSGYVEERWIAPLRETDDPVKTIKQILMEYRESAEKGECQSLQNGCPLNNIAQEMAGLDEGFRMRVEQIFRSWRAAISESIGRAQSSGRIRKDITPEHVGAFVVAALEGMVGTIKNSRSLELMDQLGKGMISYLDSLSPA